MTVTAASFRVDFTEFADTDAYPEADVAYYLKIAGLLLRADVWSTLLDIGTELLVAHHLTLEARNKAEAKNGKPPGLKVGVLSSAGVDGVSTGYDVQAVIEPGAGHWNLTTFGLRFLNVMNMVGAGPVQVGVSGFADPLSSATAWSGPDTEPGLNTFG